MRKFSVILPVRNGGEFVKDCVYSILNQDYPGIFDLVILDNCSTDETVAWLESLASPKIKIHLSRQPLSIVENWGRIREVPKNEFITIIGHDDLLGAGFLSEMNQLIQAQPTATLYQTHFNFIDEEGKQLRRCFPFPEIQHASGFLAGQMTRTQDSTGTGYVMRAKDFDGLGGMPQHYPNLIFADYQLWVNLCLQGFMAVSDKFCFSYRVHASVSKNTDGEKYVAAFGHYVTFLHSISAKPGISAVLKEYGRDFLLYFCESLSHRLLKTEESARATTVREFVRKCRQYAVMLFPGQPFHPYRKMRIALAVFIDSNLPGRSLFRFWKSLK